MKYTIIIARLALAIVFIWFGALKFWFVSPADDLVRDLLAVSMPFIPFGPFLMFLAAYEVMIGMLFLIPKLERWAVGLLLPQMFATFGPLVLLPQQTWVGWLQPTLIGQYIIKNIIIIALALLLFVVSQKNKIAEHN
jgi:uncharacterized membrane protein YkgB